MAQQVQSCPGCGRQPRAGARFCGYCGAALALPAAEPAPERIFAAAETGVIDLGELEPEAVSAASGPQGAKKGLAGFLDRLRRPGTWIPLLLTAAAWIVSALFRGSDSPAVKLLSWLSFAKGGLGRSLPGMLGGALGRGVTAAAWASLFSGGLPQAGRGVAAFWKDGGRKRSLPLLLLGAAAGAGCYLLFAGIKTASGATAMAGIAPALLSLEALGRKGGSLYRLAEGLTAKKQEGQRSPRQGLAESLLMGLPLGALLAAALTAVL